jgi:hypothetical protein
MTIFLDAAASVPRGASDCNEGVGKRRPTAVASPAWAGGANDAELAMFFAISRRYLFGDRKRLQQGSTMAFSGQHGLAFSLGMIATRLLVASCI